MPAPPQWDDASGGLAGYYTQGVLNPEGVEGAEGSQQKMKMVGFSPFGQGLFEGKKGMMQCGVNPQTGEYMTDAEGNARCWYVPTVAGGATQTVGNPGWGNGGFGSWINTDKDIVHYNGGIGLIGLSIPLLIGIALFAYRVYIMKRVNKGDEPGLLGKLVMPETWKLWGNKYTKRSSKVFSGDNEPSEPPKKNKYTYVLAPENKFKGSELAVMEKASKDGPYNDYWLVRIQRQGHGTIQTTSMGNNRYYRAKVLNKATSHDIEKYPHVVSGGSADDEEYSAGKSTVALSKEINRLLALQRRAKADGHTESVKRYDERIKKLQDELYSKYKAGDCGGEPVGSQGGPRDGSGPGADELYATENDKGKLKYLVHSFVWESEEDNYEEGLIGNQNMWEEKIGKTFDSWDEVANYLDGSYGIPQNSWYIFDNTIQANFLVDNDNSYATESEREAWKRGEKRLWDAHIDLVLTFIKEFQPTEDELTKMTGLSTS